MADPTVLQGLIPLENEGGGSIVHQLLGTPLIVKKRK